MGNKNAFREFVVVSLVVSCMSAIPFLLLPGDSITVAAFTFIAFFFCLSGAVLGLIIPKARWIIMAGAVLINLLIFFAFLFGWAQFQRALFEWATHDF